MANSSVAAVTSNWMLMDEAMQKIISASGISPRKHVVITQQIVNIALTGKIPLYKLQRQRI